MRCNRHNFGFVVEAPSGGKLRSFSSWTLALGTGLPLIGGGGTVEYLTNISAGYLNVTDKMIYKLTKHNYMDKILEGETYPSLAQVMTAMNKVEITITKNTLKQLLAASGFKMYEKHGYYKSKKSEK